MYKYSKNEYVIFISTLTVISVFMIFISIYSPEKLSAINSFANRFLVPTQKLILYTCYKTSDITGYLYNVKELRKDNERLYFEIEMKNIEQERMQSLLEENEALKKTLEIKETREKMIVESADIIAKNPSNFHKNFTINKGAQHKIKINQVVISPHEELIGRIYEVGKNWAKVLTLFDEKNAVGARIVRSHQPGVIESDTFNNNSHYKMTAISALSDVILGDHIETSGGGGIYPEGLLIGTIEDIKTELGSISQVASVIPSVNLNKIVKVFVVIQNP